MYEYDYNEEDGISLLDLLKVSIGTTRKAKIRFLIVLVVVTLIAYFAVDIFYNSKRINYTANFQYQIPSLIEKENNGVVTDVSYLDGTPFNVNSLTTLSRLKEVKASDPDFSSIDVEKMYETTQITATFTGTGEYQYSITASEKYFSNEAQAKKFINVLIQLPLTITSKLVESVDNSLYLKQATIEGNTLPTEINDLIDQASHISKTYSTLVNNGNKTKVIIDDKLVDISDLKAIAEAKIESLNLNLYLKEVEANHYVRNYSDQKIKDKLNDIYNNYVAEASELQKKIDNYNAMIQAGTMLNANYENYIKCMDRKVVVDYQVEVYEGFVNHGVESQAFEDKLANVVSTLREITDELTSVQKATYQDDSNAIYYANNNVVQKTGGINVLIIIAGSFVFGLVVAAIVNLVLGYSKYKEQKFKLDTKKETEEPKVEE